VNANRKSRSGIFLIELSIVIAVFAVCAAIALNVISVAGTELSYSENLSTAKSLSAYIAESYKSGMTVSEIEDIISHETENSDLVAKVSERVGEYNVSYLDINVSGKDISYITITCARRNDNG
jgi:type II secretory pathway pseudopilin PulG